MGIRYFGFPALFGLALIGGAQPGLNAQELFQAYEAMRSTRPPLPERAREIDETSIQFAEFEYRGGSYASEFVRLVLDYAARKPHAVAGPTPLPDLVNSVCEEPNPQTLELFDAALDEIGQIRRTSSQRLVETEDGLAPVPPCLPSLRLELVARLVLPGDRIDDYFKQDRACDDCVDMRWSDGNKSIISENRRLNEALNQRLDVDVAQVTTKLGKLIGETPANEWARLSRSGQYSIAAAHVSYKTDSELAGALADDLFLAILTGTPPEQAIDIIVGQVEALRPGSGNPIKAALQGFSKAFLSDEASRLLTVARLIAMRDAFAQYRPDDFDGASLAYAKTTIVVQKDLRPWPLIDPTTGRDRTLNPGDLVMSLAARPINAQIPIDLATVARKKGLLAGDASVVNNADIRMALIEASRIFNEEWRQNPPASRTPPASGQTQPADLAPNTSVLFTNASGCGADSSAMDDDALFRDLPAAVFRARIAMATDGTEPEPVAVVVADSGFRNLPDTAGNPYRYSLQFDETRDALLDQFDSVTEAHGTAVMGVAVGGPRAWPIAKALNLPITTRPIRIYERDLIDPTRFVPAKRSIGRALNGPPNVVNLSIGERKNALGTDGLIRQALAAHFDNASGPLFVVAAGNNGANHNPGGGLDVISIELYPQMKGGSLKNNLIVVGASDGPTRARFSNHSKEAVSILAPGCGVDSWEADPASGRYAQKTFDGTSFSAPLVTYVASLVYSLTPPDFRSSLRVKARILASSDLRHEFIGDVLDGRYLNPAKAVSLYHDVVEREVVVDGKARTEILFGEFRKPDVRLGRFCESGFVEGDTLLKIARTPEPNDGDMLVHYSWSDDAGLKRGTCHPRPSIGFTVEGTDGPTNIPIAKLVDVVFKWR